MYNCTTLFSFKTLLLAMGCCRGLPNNTRPYNILVFLPTETKSHFMGFQPLLETLVTRGHNVTLVSPFALGSGGMALPYYTHVKVEVTENVAGRMFIFIFYTYSFNYNKSIRASKYSRILYSSPRRYCKYQNILNVKPATLPWKK